MTYDPAFMNTASVQERDHLHRRRQGHPPLPRLPDRAARRAEHLPRDRVPAPERRAADEGRAAPVRARGHVPHVRARERQEAHGRASATTRTRWGCSSAWSRRSARSTRRREGRRPRRRGSPRSIRLIAKMPTHRRLRTATPGACRTSTRTTSSASRQLPPDDVQDGRAEVHAEPGARARARRAVHPPRRPRAELLDERDARRSARARSTRTARSPARRPRSTARCTAARTRPCCGCSPRSAT